MRNCYGYWYIQIKWIYKTAHLLIWGHPVLRIVMKYVKIPAMVSHETKIRQNVKNARNGMFGLLPLKSPFVQFPSTILDIVTWNCMQIPILDLKVCVSHLLFCSNWEIKQIFRFFHFIGFFLIFAYTFMFKIDIEKKWMYVLAKQLHFINTNCLCINMVQYEPN